MKTDPFTMYDAVVGTADVRHVVAIMFGNTDLQFIKQVLEKSGYPFGAPESWTKQLREIHNQWLTNGKTLEGIRGYVGMVDPFYKLKAIGNLPKPKPEVMQIADVVRMLETLKEFSPIKAAIDVAIESIQLQSGVEDVFPQKHQLSPEDEKKALEGIEKIVRTA